MMQWTFFAVWVVWLLSVVVAQAELWTWVVGVSLIAVHCYVVWRKVSRVQHEMWSRGSQDEETRQARAPFEAELERLMKSLTPVLLTASGVFVILLIVAIGLSGVGVPGAFYTRRMPLSEALVQLLVLPISHAVILAFVLREVDETPLEFVSELFEESPQEDQPPITLDLEAPPREPRGQSERRGSGS
jgi:hypothetical protein